MNKKGFTLIEIIIVIVILGVLATLALPRLAAQTKSAQAAEAMQFLGPIKRAIMACYDTGGSFSACLTQGALSITVPTSANFTYTTDGGTVGAYAVVQAQYINTTTDIIKMKVDVNGKTEFATSSTSNYIGIVNKTGSTTVLSAAAATTF